MKHYYTCKANSQCKNAWVDSVKFVDVRDGINELLINQQNFFPIGTKQRKETKGKYPLRSQGKVQKIACTQFSDN